MMAVPLDMEVNHLQIRSDVQPTGTECAPTAPVASPPAVPRTSSSAMANRPRSAESPGVFAKLAWSLPWLSRYPLWRARQFLGRALGRSRPRHVIFMVANHFEPCWNEDGAVLTCATQLARIEDWVKQARAIGRAVHDHD